MSSDVDFKCCSSHSFKKLFGLNFDSCLQDSVQHSITQFRNTDTVGGNWQELTDTEESMLIILVTWPSVCTDHTSLVHVQYMIKPTVTRQPLQPTLYPSQSHCPKGWHKWQWHRVHVGWFLFSHFVTFYWYILFTTWSLKFLLTL